MADSFRIFVDNVVLLVVCYALTLNNRCKVAVLYLTHSSVYTSIFGHRITHAESYHTVITWAFGGLHQLLADNLKRVSSVKVIRVYNRKRHIDSLVSHNYSVRRSPRFGPLVRTTKTLRQRVYRLEYHLHIYMSLIF